MYYTAAWLVHHGEATELYTGADSGADPQMLPAGAATPIYRAAHAQGLSYIGLYLYPPLLADLLVPLTTLPLPAATRIWFAFNGAFLLLTAFCVAGLLQRHRASWQTALILLSLLFFTPVLQALAVGQVTVVLLLLWATGMVLYKSDRLYAAGVVFALAAAIKLTPVVVIFPFLIWRQWRVVGAFLASLVVFAAACLWINTPHALLAYSTRVLPSMSGSIPYYSNFSLSAATARLISLVRTGAVAPFPQALAPYAAFTGRLTSIAVLVTLVTLIARAGCAIGKQDQLLILGLLSLVAPILSPVSWFHAYAMAFLAFALLWHESFERPVSLGYLLSLTAVSLLLGTAISENLLPRLLDSRHYAWLATCLQFGQLLGAIGLILYRIAKIKAVESRELVAR